MLNLIKAELYKVFNRKYIYIFLVSMAFMCLGINFLISGSHVHVSLFELMSLILQALIGVIYLLIIPIDMTTCDEMKQGTLKNTVSFGIPRSKVFLSKILVSIILSLITGIVLIVFFLGSAYLLFPLGPKFTSVFLNSFVQRLLLSIPLYIGVVVIGTFLSFLLKNNTAFSLTYVALFIMVSPIIKLLSALVSPNISKLLNILITHNLGLLSTKLTSNQMLQICGVGLGYIIIFTIAGLILVNRQEIK